MTQDEKAEGLLFRGGKVSAGVSEVYLVFSEEGFYRQLFEVCGWQRCGTSSGAAAGFVCC